MPDAMALAKRFIDDIISSPLNMLLVGLIFYFSYKLFVKDRKKTNNNENVVKRLPKMNKRDFTLDELKPFNGTQSDGRILVAILGKVFDVSPAAHFYGPGGPYGVFAGRDASRALATFSVEESAFKEVYDDLADLSPSELESVKEWELQFLEKYDVVGKLLKPDEAHTDYSETETNSEKNATTTDTELHKRTVKQ